MKKVGDFVGKYMAVIVLIVAAIAFLIPRSFVWIESSFVNYFLMIVMFGMGLTLKPMDFKVVFTHPVDIVIGCVAQFTIMPFLAFVLSKLFNLEPGLMAGVILVGTCPGGTSSNIITYLSKGDVALSVGMTSVNTLLAPFLTPAITYLLLNTTVDVDVKSMFLSIIKIVILPIVLGFLINRKWSRQVQKIMDLLPVISVAAVTLVVATVVSHNSKNIIDSGVKILAIVLLHNILGYAVGYVVATLLHMTFKKRKTLSIEIGMQNSGLATSLAATSFPNLAMATVPGALFSVCHNITGALLANFYRGLEDRCDKPE